MLAAEVLQRPPAGLVYPDDLVEEVVLAEDLVHDEPQVGVGAVVDVQKEHAVAAQQSVAAHEHRAHHLKKRIPAHGIGEGLHLKRPTARLPVRLAHAHAHREALARLERRIQIDQLDLALLRLKQRVQALNRVAEHKAALRSASLVHLPRHGNSSRLHSATSI